MALCSRRFIDLLSQRRDCAYALYAQQDGGVLHASSVQDGGVKCVSSVQQDGSALGTSVNNAYVVPPKPSCEQQGSQPPATTPPLAASIITPSKNYIVQHIQPSAFYRGGGGGMNATLEPVKGNPDMTTTQLMAMPVRYFGGNLDI